MAPLAAVKVSGWHTPGVPPAVSHWNPYAQVGRPDAPQLAPGYHRYRWRVLGDGSSAEGGVALCDDQGTGIGACSGEVLPQVETCLTGGGVLFGCAPGLTCDFDTDVCVTLVDNGAACTVDDQCGGACSAGVCAAPGVCD